ncbi:MAG: YhhA family cyclophane-containing RiPP [Brevundimonas sp.]|jgi:hypothetical protein|nr:MULTISPECIES: YhhA family cyclophane-containing RiPP [Brevundimonas]
MDRPQQTDTILRAKEVPSAALARLIGEVTGPEVKAAAGRYNRTHNRHNR